MDPIKVGDKIIYPNHGLGFVEAIDQATHNGETFKVIHLRILSSNALVLLPVSVFAEVGIRRPMEEKAVKKIFSYIRSSPDDIIMNWKGRYKEHIDLMKSGTLMGTAQVLKSLHCLNMIKPLSYREKNMMEKAKELLVIEISTASCLPNKKIEEKIEDALSKCFFNHQHRVNP